MQKYNILLSEPDLTSLENRQVNKCIEDNWISSSGPYIERFEKSFSGYLNRKYGIATSNGTSAIELALKAVGVNKNSKVVIPDWTFSATANAVLSIGATPILSDVNKNDFSICIEFLKKQIIKYRNIDAIVLVYPLGWAYDTTRIYNLANENNIPIIEDAAGAIGSKFKKNLIGSKGKIVTFSFNGNKILTCGGGGIVLTDQEKIAEKIKLLRTNSVGSYNYNISGYNHQMLNMSAAVGCAQLKRLDGMIKKRQNVMARYLDEIPKSHKYSNFFLGSKQSVYNGWLNAMVFKDKSLLDDLIAYAEKFKIQMRSFWPALSETNAFKNLDSKDLINSKIISRKILTIPSSSTLKKQDQDKVIKIINDWLQK